MCLFFSYQLLRTTLPAWDWDGGLVRLALHTPATSVLQVWMCVTGVGVLHVDVCYMWMCVTGVGVLQVWVCYMWVWVCVTGVGVC